MSTKQHMAVLERLFSLDGKTALVTGGTSGIGKMIATGLVQAGAKTYVTSRKPESCEEAAAELSKFGDCLPLPGDVATKEGCDAIAAAFRESESKLDILVNAAGTTWGAPLAEYPDKAWDKVMGINVKGIFHLTVALLDELKAAGSDEDPAKVINVGSVHGFVAPPWESYAYSASKAATHQLTRHLAKRLGPEHVVVNAIAPGPFPSRMMHKVLDHEGEQLIKETATGRLGRDDDMAAIAIYLAGRGAGHVTGAIIPVDGGYGTLR